MNRWLALLGVTLTAFVASGCTQVDATDEIPNVNKSLSTLVPEYVDLSKLKLPNGRRFLSLGESEDKALSVFPKPSRGFPLDETVPGLPIDFKSKGWETGTEGFGIILHDDKVVLAMHQFEGVEADEFANILEIIKTTNGLDHFQSITQDKAEYWFVKYGLDEIILSRVPTMKKRYQVTVTIGNEHILDTLGILRDVKKIDLQPQTEKHAR
jgi:hypothetical protein